MSQRINLTVAVCFLAGAIVYWAYRSHTSSPSLTQRDAPQTTEPAGSASPSAGRPTEAAMGSANLAVNAAAYLTNADSQAVGSRPTAPAAVLAAPAEFTNLPPEIVLEHLRTTFRAYQSMFGGNPVGTNPEITAALNGGNPKQAQFLSEDKGMRVNARGELVDPWGTPYFFHQLSGTEMEIHSAGPDRILWTADDLVIK